MNNVAQNGEKSIIGAIKIDKKEVQEHMDKLVRESVEEVLNKLLNAEADAICNASRYERSPDRLDTRAGTYKRKLLTKAGEVELQVPRLRTLPFETQIIERYHNLSFSFFVLQRGVRSLQIIVRRRKRGHLRLGSVRENRTVPV